MTRPHIVVDARMISDGGIGTYLQNVLPRAAIARPDWRFTALGDRGAIQRSGTPANVGIRACTAGIYTVAEQFELPVRCPAGASMFWAPHYNIPVFLRGPRLAVTIHDVAHLALPELTGGILRRTYARSMYSVLRRRANAILYVSEFSRREAKRLVGDCRCESTVAHLGVDVGWFDARAKAPEPPISEPYFVYVGNFKAHKNVPLLLRAFRRVRDRMPHRLVLIGRREGLRADPSIPSGPALAAEGVLVTGEISREDLQRYVVHAAGFVTASLYEGFGLPALEAMAAGCPCLVSSAGSLPEICGDAALYCDPRDEESVAARLIEIGSDERLRRLLVERGHVRARQFDWDRCAAATVELLERALSAPPN